MMTDVSTLSDDALNVEVKRVAQAERRATAELLRLLVEVERRGLHLALGHSSLFGYCTRALLLSEQAAYSCITAARTANRFPQVLTLLTDGALTLSSVGLLAPHLTDETADALFDAARFKSTREVERVIASAFPQPDIPTLVRALPHRTAESEPVHAPLLSRAHQEATATAVANPSGAQSACRLSTPSARPMISPISPKRYLLKLTMSEDTHDKLQRARALLRHSIPDGDLDRILNRALSLLIDQVVRTRIAGGRGRRHRASNAKGRRIPAAVRRAVWERDGGRCVFTTAGEICGETAFLEFHHVIPFATGGPTEVSNLQLRCRAHNAYESAVYFGSNRHDSFNSARAESG